MERPSDAFLLLSTLDGSLLVRTVVHVCHSQDQTVTSSTQSENSATALQRHLCWKVAAGMGLQLSYEETPKTSLSSNVLSTHVTVYKKQDNW